MSNTSGRARLAALDWLRLLLLLLMLIGIAFRFVNLDRKVFWHDEVYTSMRAAGYTRGEIDQDLFQNRILTAPDLQQYQRLKPGSNAGDTIASLVNEDPQHPPLYFLLARFWMRIFGSSLTAVRSLPTLLSLLALPLMAGLAWELFHSRLTALLAVALLAISPFDILFAQTARQYSLLTMVAIGSSYLLLRAMRLGSRAAWGLYVLSSTIGLYTHPFFGLTLLAQGSYVLLLWGWQKLRPSRTVLVVPFPASFLAAIATTLLLYSPWIYVLLTRSGRAMATTDWARIKVGLFYLIKLWLLSFTALFFDLDFGFDNPWTYVPRIILASLVGWGLTLICRRTDRRTWLFVLTTILVPFLALVLPDLLLGGKRSAVSRYLISCYPGIQLAMAYLLAAGLQSGKFLWRGITALLVTGSILSCTVSALAETWWSKDLSYFNADVIRQLNARPAPLVICDMGSDFTNTGDLISLSYGLKPEVQFLLLGAMPRLDLGDRTPVLVWRPSPQVEDLIAKRGTRLRLISAPDRLWEVEK
ncbi:glycosyl transferase family 39 [Leptolyngbya sp. 'hensonii']|uniref:glycosyltransferase family 39 protein n=1 Tax=Leptolyngbya sp. 'hensonii' TaxID=1922337 RepID=UPI00094FFDE2|nr:glycosyltransferase family 39 protein [Leptolyngbya sp. 'hensonii']OLP17348.1 glycosyl transferase family 39 [Leptolyngbya sp. 'hensonii']